VHLYAIRPHKDKRGVDPICDVLLFGRLWYTEVADAISYAKFYSRSHDAVIGVYDEMAMRSIGMRTPAILTNRKNCRDLSGERIDHSVHGSSCAFHNAVPDILGCVRSALRHIGCRVDGSRLNAANREGGGENDRKERFHGT
jgi:hypothetical protein